MKIERYYTCFGRKVIDAGGLGLIESLDRLLVNIWTYANKKKCDGVLSLKFSSLRYYLTVGEMEAPMDIKERMVNNLMDLDQEEYQSLFIELIRASKAIYSRMNVRETFEISLEPKREMTSEELESLNRFHCISPECTGNNVVCLEKHPQWQGEETDHYKCNDCGAEWSLWKQTISGVVLKEAE